MYLPKRYVQMTEYTDRNGRELASKVLWRWLECVGVGRGQRRQGRDVGLYERSFLHCGRLKGFTRPDDVILTNACL